MPLYRALNANAHILPVPLVNLINGGRHASNDLDFQEFIVIPVGADSILEALQISTEVNLALAEILLERYGKSALNTGDEGGYAPAISSPQEALGLLHEAVDDAGHAGRFRYGLDCAATHYYDRESGNYALAGETRDTESMIELYLELIRDFDLITIEDPLDEDDFTGFAALTAQSGIQIVGDDLFVTNSGRLREGIATGAANALLWKVNQIGTLSEALDAADLAHRNALQGGRLGALGRDRGPDHRGPRRRARRRPDQDRRPGPRRADGEVQPPAPDLRGARRRRPSTPVPSSRRPWWPREAKRWPPTRADPSRELADRALARRSPRQGDASAREAALRVAAAGLVACDVGRATRLAVALAGDELIVDGRRHRLDPGGRVIVVGAGKASLAIAGALERILGDRLDGGADRRPRRRAAIAGRVEVLGVGPPAAERREASARHGACSSSPSGAGERDLVIACFTGGSSALASLPPESVAESEKRDLHELLLSSGIGIVEVNTVRKHVSAIKGGRLAAASLPARLINLTVSDVAGDHIDAITDPSVADSSRAVGRDRGPLRPRALGATPRGRSASTCRARSPSRRRSTPPRSRPCCWSPGRPPATRWRSRRPAGGSTRWWSRPASRARRARSASCSRTWPATALGDGAPVRGRHGDGRLRRGEHRDPRPADADFGEGGPEPGGGDRRRARARGAPVAAVFLDTDGSDGGTGARRGDRRRRRPSTAPPRVGLDLRAALLEHRSSVALAALEDALVTGPTGTNVNDLFAIVDRREES